MWQKITDYARAHRGQVVTVAVVVCGLVARFVPGFPSEQIVDLVSALLGA